MFAMSLIQDVQFMRKNSNNTIARRYDDAVQIVADFYKVTPSYIRKVIKDKDQRIYKGPNPERIRTVYNQYKSGKNILIKQIEQLVKLA
ncbi:MAG: hypothetical protein EAZ35_02280 [Sphingobacteriia bacterium]|nr:MAG: hypothetical protein EAZ35_02280 [Sphingobacteriia bacterium]